MVKVVPDGICHLLPLPITLAKLFIELFRHTKLLSNSPQDRTDPLTVLSVIHAGKLIIL
jgi:hypothetical protein